MTTGNLIPVYRRRARHRRRLARRWSGATAGYLALLVAGYAVMRAHFAVDETFGEQLAVAQEAVAAQVAEIGAIRRRLDETRATLNATRMVENQADWSVLLAIVVEEMGEDVVLRECVLEPMAPTRPGAGTKGAAVPDSAHSPGGPERYEVRLRGFGRSQMAVSQFVLRLERAGLFSKVTLEESRREGFLDGDAISFRLRCELSPREEPPT